MVVVQYPHTLTATIPGSSYQDDDGNWQTSDPVTRTEACRAEPNSSGRSIVGSDGTQIYFAWIVYLPKGVVRIPIGTSVAIASGYDSIGEGTIKRFSNGELNTRIWL